MRRHRTKININKDNKYKSSKIKKEFSTSMLQSQWTIRRRTLRNQPLDPTSCSSEAKNPHSPKKRPKIRKKAQKRPVFCAGKFNPLFHSPGISRVLENPPFWSNSFPALNEAQISEIKSRSKIQSPRKEAFLDISHFYRRNE